MPKWIDFSHTYSQWCLGLSKYKKKKKKRFRVRLSD